MADSMPGGPTFGEFYDASRELWRFLSGPFGVPAGQLTGCGKP
jgi:hypothetical protein